MTSQIAFIGGGNMGRAMIGGLIARGHPREAVWVADPISAVCASLIRDFGVNGASDNPSAALVADVVVFAVKPQQMADTVRRLAPVLAARQPLVVSIAAGITTASLTHWIGAPLPLVRAMPNTPALIGRGATGAFATPPTSPAARAQAAQLLGAVGFVAWVDYEEQLDAVTALSGSGPAYFFLLIEWLERAAVDLGLPADTARQLALETAVGAAELAQRSTLNPAELRAQVTSKGGTTERALQIFEAGGFGRLVTAALAGAAIRARELSVEFGTP